MYMTIERQDINLFTTTEESLYGGQLTMMASAVSHPSSIVEMCVHTRKENVSVKLNVIDSFSGHYRKNFSIKIKYGWVSLKERRI